MACKLNKFQVEDLYTVLYAEISDRIKNPELPPIDINDLVKEAYNVVNTNTGDPVKAMYFAQAIPDVFQLVVQDEKANDYLVENDFDFNGLAKMRKAFADLIEVGKAVETPKKSKQEIDSEIKNTNKGKKDFSPKVIDETDFWSFNEDNGAKVASAWVTSIQMAYAGNPEKLSDEERNKLDPEKKLFGDVVKAIVQIAKDRVGSNDIEYNGKVIALTAQLTRTVPKELLTSSDRKYITDNPKDDGIVAVITDSKGEFIYFKPDGTITENPEEGRIVYQYLRKVNLVEGRLLLSNKSNRHYNLVEPEVLATRQKDLIETQSNGKIKVSDEDYKKMVKEHRDRQNKEMNELYELRNLIQKSNGDLQVILPILGGSFGIPNTAKKTMTIAEAGLTENDVKQYNAITTGPRELIGRQYIIVQRSKAGGLTVDQEMLLQRSDIKKDLAEKIATILTTTAKLKGRQLTPSERKKFFEIFINNALMKDPKFNYKRNLPYNRDRIRAEVVTINNESTLVVEIDGKPLPQDTLYTEETRQQILNHLLNARPKDLNPNERWPANIQYNNAYFGTSFTDYEVNGDTITSKNVQYFEAIKPYIRIEFTDETNSYENGLNSYLTFAIPEGTVEGKGKIPVGRPRTRPATPAARTRTDKEQTSPVPRRQARTTPVTAESPYAVIMKQQIEEAGGNSENYKGGLKAKDLAEQVNLTEEQIVEFRAKASETLPKKEDVAPTPAETEEAAKEEKVKVNPATRVSLIDDIINGSSNSAFYKKKGMDRSKLRDKFLDRVFTSKKDRDDAEKWWKNSPLSKFITLERITEVVNSDAFATWAGYGITLYEADGGTMVDVYHEAWHGFSQLFLTIDEKIKLYEEASKLPKYKGMTFSKPEDYEIIEEDIAEEFRSYAKSGGKKATKSFLEKVFDKIYQFLQRLLGKTNKKEVATKLQDIETIKVLFDKLYRASTNPDILSNLKPSMDNVMFGKLNRSKTINDNFTLEESKKIADAMDSMMAIIFQAHNRDFNTTSAALKLLKDPDNKKDLYRDIYDRFERLRLGYIQQLSEDADLILDPQFYSDLQLLEKITSNYGNLTGTLDGNDKNNVIAYHVEKSRFRVLRDQYIEIEDPSNIEKSNLFKLNDGGNSISSKELASEDTMMLLASIFKVTRENGEIVTNREGLFGLPELQDINITWNKLAKILEGSFDEIDMYVRLYENSENYPELKQLETLLPNPFFTIESAMGMYNPLEFEAETSFWQDFKKPRIPFIQLNLNKEVTKSEDGVNITYEARLAKANFDVYQVIQDWKSNFITADTTINPYIIKIPKTGVTILDTQKIVEEFGNNGRFNYKRANEFLQAIGIVLDQSSTAIQEIIESRNEPFSTTFGIDRMYEIIKKVNNSSSPDAFKFKKDPLFYLINGLPESLREDKKESEAVQGRIRTLAGIQNAFSDSYANFSVQTPEGNKVWEHMVDSTITRLVTAINHAETWQELTTDAADPNGRFKHMRWLNEANNTLSPFSKILASIFDLDQMSSTYGQKLTDTKIVLQNVAGTQMVGRKNEGGTSTASMDATSKYLQEFHTMLLSGVEEFMRHASKNTAMGLTIDGEIKTYNGKEADKLYVDIESFLPYNDGIIQAYDIIEGYLVGEGNRIFRFKQNIDVFKNYAGYNRKTKRKDGKKTVVMAGEAFTAFDDVLSETTQAQLYAIIDKASQNINRDFNLMTELDNNPTLRDLIRKDVEAYFEIDTMENLSRLQKAKYVDKGLVKRITDKNPDVTPEETEEGLMRAYTYNSFIHKMETVILAYGDLVQYNHAKEEFHKRNAGLASGGRGFRADRRAQIHISSLKNYYAERQGYTTRNYDGTLRTAIIKEMKYNSLMYKEYRDQIEESIYQRTKNRKLAKENADKAASEYFDSQGAQMKIADGQGYITMEHYRILKRLESNWSDQQELLYRKISLGENVTAEDIVEFFPPYKLQYFGNIKSEGLPVNSFHKFSLAPIIPGVWKQGTPLYDLHEKMMKDQVDYVLFESGSKVSHIGTGDVILNEDGSINKDANFTVNTIYADFLKNQTEINPSYKGKSIFSTQLRKLILEGLYEQGRIKSTNYEDITDKKVRRYLDHVEEYTNLLKIELLEEMGYEETEPGEYKAKDKTSISKLVNMIRTNLEREDVLSDELIDFIDVFDNSGDLEHDLSFHPEAAKIEKLLLSMINKRIIKQKVSGEPLIQVSVGLTENQFDSGLRKARKDEIAKWSTYGSLPPYHKKVVDLNVKYEGLSKEKLQSILQQKQKEAEEQAAYYTDTHRQALRAEINYLEDVIAGKKPKVTTVADGYTAAAKVMIAMQGTYYNLFNLEYQDGETIGVYFEDGTLDMETSLDRLNEKLKDEAWLDENDGSNRKAITLVGVRIPVQGLNSMEFMEVFEFLPPQAGNIIISPAEIVAKSGGDFDIDKMTMFMNTLDENGKVIKRSYSNNEEIKNLRGTSEFLEAVKAQKYALENELIDDIKNILELPDNYTSLIMPNGTFILKDIADKLASKVMRYNPKKNKMTEDTGEISPTRVLEALYNVYKHESNIVGKKTLGLGAIENTFNVIMNALGAYMPTEYIISNVIRKSNMRLRHNTMDKNGEDVISISNQYDVDGINKVADVISQMMNGWVDVEKDAWVFFIQGNYEVAPTLLYLVKAGVPVKEAIYFVSNPLVREYVDEQRLAKSTFAEVLGKKPKVAALAKYKAASEVIGKFFTKDELAKNSKNDDRYLAGQKLLDNYFADRKNKSFTEQEMETLINESQINIDAIIDKYYDKWKILPPKNQLHILVKEAEKEITEKLKSNDQAKAMFLHYLELEQQISGYTALKMSSNPDTSTKSTLSDVEQTEANIADLFFDSRVPLDIVESMMDDSILKSFFNGPLALAVSRPLFKLRYHRTVSDYLISRKNQIRKDLDTTFPGQNIEMFSNVFRNDIVSFIFQNALRRYNKEDSFMSLNMEDKVPIAYVKELTRGAFVKNGTMYIDPKQLKKEFEQDAYVEGSDSSNSYEDRGLYPLHPATFKNNGETNFNQYQKFVLEREYLRSITPLTTEYVDTVEFQEELQTTQDLFPDLSNEKAIRYTYEKLLAVKALDNAYNFFHLFQDSENSFAVRLSRLIQTYPTLAKNYPVLSRLKLDSNKEDTVFNTLLAEKSFDNDKSNLYTNDLKRLSDINVIKVDDPIENARISQMFTYLNTFAFLQTGLNKTKLSFTNIVDYSAFLTVVEEESEKFINALDSHGFTVLDNFYDQFIRENNKDISPDKDRFKDYLSDMDYANPQRISPTANPTRKVSAQKPEQTFEESLKIFKPKGTINVYWGQAESATSTRILSNLAPREFTWEGRRYGSVEHAYQSNKSGTFDQSTYDAYVDAGGYGTKIRGKATTKGFDNLQLMKDLVVESFIQNPDSEAAKKLLQYAKFTHNTNEVIDKAFLEGLKLAQTQLSRGQVTSEQVITDSTTTDTVEEVTRFGLKTTDQEGVFTYDDSEANNLYYYTNIGKNNPNVIFVYNTSVYEIKPEQVAKGVNLGGSSNFMTEVGNMSVNIPTDLFASVVNGQPVELDSKQYETLKKIWEKRLDLIVQLKEKGAEIAFPEYGFADPATMPQELFVYLSKRLFETLQYVNPGSTMYNEISKMVGESQGISDEEILLQLELEEDPFKCS